MERYAGGVISSVDKADCGRSAVPEQGMARETHREAVTRTKFVSLSLHSSRLDKACLPHVVEKGCIIFWVLKIKVDATRQQQAMYAVERDKNPG